MDLSLFHGTIRRQKPIILFYLPKKIVIEIDLPYRFYMSAFAVLLFQNFLRTTNDHHFLVSSTSYSIIQNFNQVEMAKIILTVLI